MQLPVPDVCDKISWKLSFSKKKEGRTVNEEEQCIYETFRDVGSCIYDGAVAWYDNTGGG